MKGIITKMKNRLVELRKEKGLTQVELAQKSGVSLQMIKILEKDDYDFMNCHCYTLYKLMETLNCKIGDLLPQFKR